MKNKLLKRLTTVVVAAAMVATMVTGFSVETKAGNSIEGTWLFNSCEIYGQEYQIGDSAFGITFSEDSTVFEFANGKVNISGIFFEMAIGETGEYDYVEKDNGCIILGVIDFTVNGNKAKAEIDGDGDGIICFTKQGGGDDDDDDDKPAKKSEKKKSESKYVAPKEENPAFTHPDREKLKSILPQKSVIALNGALYDDLKVFVANDTTKANQALLVNNFATTAGKKARILVSDSLYTSRMLGGDNGKTRTLKWVNLEKNPQIVYACCYNQTDKAYFIQGILDKDGTATFNDFILRDMTNITIFVLE